MFFKTFFPIKKMSSVMAILFLCKCLQPKLDKSCSKMSSVMAILFLCKCLQPKLDKSCSAF